MQTDAAVSPLAFGCGPVDRSRLVRHPATVHPSVITELEAIRELVRRNVPRSHNPEAFHEDKSDITGRLTKVLNALRKGGPVAAG